MTALQLALGGFAVPSPAPGLPRQGARSVEYIESASILRPASGFMKAYRWVLNPYSGCGFGCDYCYARSFAPTEMARDAWGRWVKVKENAVALIEKATRARSPSCRLAPGDSVYLSSVTDPYQPVEAGAGLTRRVLEALLPVQPRLTVQTRSPLVTRDIDLLRQFSHVRVSMTVTTDDEGVRRRYEPSCPPIEARFAALEQLRAVGIPIGVSVAPMLPLRDADAFGRRLAELEAAEYVTQFLHQGGGRFRATTASATLTRVVRDDGWTGARYAAARDAIRAALAPVPLLEGAAGFAPPP